MAGPSALEGCLVCVAVAEGRTWVQIASTIANATNKQVKSDSSWRMFFARVIGGRANMGRYIGAFAFIEKSLFYRILCRMLEGMTVSQAVGEINSKQKLFPVDLKVVEKGIKELSESGAQRWMLENINFINLTKAQRTDRANKGILNRVV